METSSPGTKAHAAPSMGWPLYGILTTVFFIWFLASHALAGALDCAALFKASKPEISVLFPDNGKQTASEAYRLHLVSQRAYQVSKPGSADLDVPFFVVNHEKFTAMMGNSSMNYFDLATNVFRNIATIKLPGDEVFIDNGVHLDPEQKSPETYLSNHRILFKSLYERFGRSEEAISLERPEYNHQDIQGEKRTTHFVISSAEKALSHIQAQYSTVVSDPYNVERDLVDVKVDRSEGPTFELGRARILAQFAREILPDLSSREAQVFLTVMTYQKALSWLNSDVLAAQVVIHTNKAVKHIIQKIMHPVEFDHEILGTTKSGAKEWALLAKRKTLLKFEEKLMLNLIALKARYLLKVNPKTAPNEEEFFLTFRQNEIAVLRRIGVLTFQDDIQEDRFMVIRRNFEDRAVSRGVLLITNQLGLEALLSFVESVAKNRYQGLILDAL